MFKYVFSVGLFSDLLIRRDDVVYRWLIDGSSEQVSAVPMCGYVFTEDGMHNVTMIASNLGKDILKNI